LIFATEGDHLFSLLRL